jgi:ion channel POLLUX/CASTOR
MLNSNTGRKASRRGRARAPFPSPKSSGSLLSGPPQVNSSNRETPNANERAGWLERFRYRFEQTLAKGPARVIGWLSLLTLSIIVLTGLVELSIGKFGGARDGSVFENFWQAMLRVLDSGTFAGDADWPTRLLSLAITVAGIFIAGSLIGLIATTVDRKIEDLAKGRSRVIEDDHTIILGWNDHISALVSELVEANRSAKGKPIVILAAKEKAEMEALLAVTVSERHGSSIVLRSGDPASPDDLRRVNLLSARSVVVLRGESGDPGVVKAVLAVRGVDPELLRPVVCELNSVSTAQLLRSVTDGKVLTVNSDRVIAEVTAQACRQEGLAAVYRELLDFDGDEIYIQAVPQAVGQPYANAQFGFASSTLIGVALQDGTVQLNPPADRVTLETDQLIVVAADDDTVIWNGDAVIPRGGTANQSPAKTKPIRVLMVGWGSLGSHVIRELDEFVGAGTTIEIVADPDIVMLPDAGSFVTSNARISVKSANVDAAAALDTSGYDQVIVLSYRDNLGVDEADSRTLLTLLSLRRTLTPEARIVGEILDPANVVLAQSTGADDFIVSDELVALMVAQLSEQPLLQAVFDDLFDANGAAIMCNPASWYTTNLRCVWGDIAGAAVERNETAIGLRTDSTGAIRLNYPKHDQMELTDADDVIVIAGR